MKTAPGPRIKLNAHVLRRVIAAPGQVWTPADFVDIGPRAAVDKTLQRLVEVGELRRIARGLYDRPRLNQLTGKPTVPDASAVVDAIARRDQTRVVVDGMTAANDLGLTTAVPARVIVLTDARLRPIRLGSQQIAFRQAAPSRLYWANRPAMRVVQALYWLHDLLPADRDSIMSRLAVVLADPDHGSAIRDDLRSGLPKLPIWMQTIVRDLLSGNSQIPEPTGRVPVLRRDRTTGKARTKSPVSRARANRRSKGRPKRGKA